MLPDTADAFPRCRFCISPPVHNLAPLRSLTNTLASLADNLYIQELYHTPVLHKFSHRFALRNLPSTYASFSQRNLFLTDASRPKSAGAPLKSHKVEQVPPCIYRAELVGDLASPSPSSFRLLKDKKQPASGLFSAPKPWQYFVRPLYNESYQTKRTVLHIRLFSHTSNHCVRQFIIQLYKFAAQSSSISNRLLSMLFVELSIFADVSAASSLSKASTSVT